MTEQVKIVLHAEIPILESVPNKAENLKKFLEWKWHLYNGIQIGVVRDNMLLSYISSVIVRIHGNKEYNSSENSPWIGLQGVQVKGHPSGIGERFTTVIMECH